MLAQKSGYAANALGEFLTRLDERNSSVTTKNGMFASHPATKERVDKIKLQSAAANAPVVVPVIFNASKEKAHTILPHVHLVFSLVKRWVLGTHQGSVSRKHLRAYLEEFTFRFNRRKAKTITHFFQRLAEGLVRQRCRPYWQIAGRLAADRPLELAA